MKITFTTFKRINPDRDGFDFLYFYKDSESDTIHKFHAVISTYGAERAWNVTEEVTYKIAQKAFVLVDEYIRAYWNSCKRLPDEDKEYFEKSELGRLSEKSIPWENHTIDLQ